MILQGDSYTNRHHLYRSVLEPSPIFTAFEWGEFGGFPLWDRQRYPAGRDPVRLITPDGPKLVDAKSDNRPYQRWADEVLERLGFADPQSARKAFDLPQGRWLVWDARPPEVKYDRGIVHDDPTPQETRELRLARREDYELAMDDRAVLRRALVAGLSNDVYYDSERPLVWTESRLSRFIRLFRTKDYYASDREPSA
jgi:hypothetical protein